MSKWRVHRRSLPPFVLLGILGLAVGASTAPAQVRVAGSAEHLQKSTPDIDTNIIPGFETPVGVDRKLVVTASWEGFIPITSIRYGSQFFTEAVTTSAGRNSSIWYLDAPDFGSRDIVVTFAAATDSRVGALSLQHAAPGAPGPTASASLVLTAGLTTTTTPSLVIGVYTENGGSTLSSDFANTLYSGDSGSSVGHTGYQNETTAGAKSYTWSADNNGNAIALAAFDDVVPTNTLDPEAIDYTLAHTTDRQEQGLLAQLLKTFPSSGMWYYEDLALAAYGLNVSNEVADAGLVAARTNGVYQSRVDEDSFHWNAYLQERIFFLYSSGSSFYPGRMSLDAENAVLGMLWDWASPRCDIGMADPETVRFSWGSENHDAQAWVSFWGAAKIFANHPVYSTATYADGSSPADMAAAFDAYFKVYVREKALKGLPVEVASPTYAKYTLNTWLNLADFADDPELKAAAGALQDIYWADWALEHLNGVRGGSRHRSYAGRASIEQTGAESHCWYHFGIGLPRSTHPGAMCAMTTFWRPSRATVGLVLDPIGRGSFGYASRRMGHRDPAPPPAPPALESGDYNPLDPDGGHLLRYTWSTPDFVVGMSQVEVLPAADWINFSSQNRWNGVIFGGHPTARIFTQRPKPAVGSVYNAEWGVQQKGAMILQRITTASRATGQMVWFDFALNREESNGWIFAEAPRAFAAVRIVDGGWNWEPDSLAQHRSGSNTNIGEWAVLNDQFSPVILEVGRKQAYADMAAFQSEILANPLAWDGARLDYTSTGYDTTLTLFADESAPPRVDGVPVDFTPSKNYDAPYLQGDFAGGPVTIQYGGERTVHGVAPFADDAETVALWHFDEVVSDTDYPDDTSVTARAPLNAVEHVDSTNSISVIPDGKFGNAIRCAFEAGDQYMMTGSSVWPADQGTFRYQGWIRLNPGDAGGYLFHVHDQVHLSVDATTATFAVNRSGTPADTSATNLVQLSASISPSNEWQYVEALYDGDRIRLVTEVENVSALGIGPFTPNDRNIYIGSRKDKSNFVGDMDEVKISSFSAQDPVVVAGSTEHLQSSNPDLDTNTLLNFAPAPAPAANSKLVVAASWESAAPGIAGVTYAGQPFTEAVSENNGRQSSLWYLDLNELSPAVGDVVVTFPAPTDSRIGVLSLQHAAPGGPVQTASAPNSVTTVLTNLYPHSLAVGVYTENGNGGLSSDFADTLYSGNSGSSVGNAGYQVEAVPGASAYTWAAATNSCAVVAAIFAPAPRQAQQLADDDADGMADAWEVEHFGSMGASDGTADADGDRFSDVQEFIAGTIPLDAASFLEITGWDGTSTISWKAVQGKHYRVLSSTNLVDGAWNEEASGVPGTPPESSVSVPSPEERAFYRIATE